MSLTSSNRKALIRLASALPEGSEERRAVLAGLQLTPWMTNIGLWTEYGVLRLFLATPTYAIYLSPGPMKRAGNFEYALERKDGKLHLPTDEEIASHRKNQGQIVDEISKGSVAWWMPSGRLYHFGIQITPTGEDWFQVQGIGRPNNAQGYSLDLGDFGLLSEPAVQKTLDDFSTAREIRTYLRKFDGKAPKFLDPKFA